MEEAKITPENDIKTHTEGTTGAPVISRGGQGFLAPEPESFC